MWKPISGTGDILSWVVFHRQYFDDFPVPYNVVAIKLSEGPIFLTNLAGALPEQKLIGRPVRIEYQTRANGDVLPVAALADQ
ncbi:MAG: OB-fold domain-containing protein [Afipia sp.]|nr:OB-fold domain-containing protein [Afipia sp.]